MVAETTPAFPWSGPFNVPKVVCPVTATDDAKVAAPVYAEVPPILRVLAKRLVEEAVVAKKLVLVALVEVLFEAVKFWRVVDPFARRLVMVALDAKRLVEDAVVAKKLVVVAEVPVAFEKVKFWRVVEPDRRRFESEVRPAVAVKVPVKLAADEMV